MPAQQIEPNSLAPPRPTPARATSPYVRIDSHGVMRVADTRISLDSIVIGFQQGESPEAIQKSYPAVSLEQVYGVIAYYLGNRDEVDAYLRSQDAVWEYLQSWSEAQPSPVRDRLRALKQEREAQQAGTHAGTPS